MKRSPFVSPEFVGSVPMTWDGRLTWCLPMVGGWLWFDWGLA